MESLLNYKQAGEILGVTSRQVFSFVKSGELAVVDLGHRNKRINPAALRRFIEGRTKGKDKTFQ